MDLKSAVLFDLKVRWLHLCHSKGKMANARTSYNPDHQTVNQIYECANCYLNYV
jgi:predicted CxxxxCH...CXXCH cytochrome family protein